MAWVIQSFKVAKLMGVDLFSSAVTITGIEGGTADIPGAVTILPKSKEDAHAAAMMFRRAARRLEEIGKELE